MKFFRFYNEFSEIRLGVEEAGQAFDLTEQIGTDILRLIKEQKINDKKFLDEIQQILSSKKPHNLSYSELEKYSAGRRNCLLIPFNPPEVWAVGVTYKKIMELHEEDMEKENGYRGLYAYVYNSVRPEIFFKALQQHCVGTNEEFSVRSDSNGTIIEAELACIFDSRGEIVAFTGANDVTAWDLEKECPLFLNQAKIFKGSCVLGPAIVPASELKDPLHLEVNCEVYRDEKLIFKGNGNTKNLKRSLKELTKYLLMNNSISDGTILCTGTAVGVPAGLTIEDGDYVSIHIENIGSLNNFSKKLEAAQ